MKEHKKMLEVTSRDGHTFLGAMREMSAPPFPSLHEFVQVHQENSFYSQVWTRRDSFCLVCWTFLHPEGGHDAQNSLQSWVKGEGGVRWPGWPALLNITPISWITHIINSTITATLPQEEHQCPGPVRYLHRSALHSSPHSFLHS